MLTTSVASTRIGILRLGSADTYHSEHSVRVFLSNLTGDVACCLGDFDPGLDLILRLIAQDGAYGSTFSRIVRNDDPTEFVFDRTTSLGLLQRSLRWADELTIHCPPSELVTLLTSRYGKAKEAPVSWKPFAGKLTTPLEGLAFGDDDAGRRVEIAVAIKFNPNGVVAHLLLPYGERGTYFVRRAAHGQFRVFVPRDVTQVDGVATKEIPIAMFGDACMARVEAFLRGQGIPSDLDLTGFPWFDYPLT